MKRTVLLIILIISIVIRIFQDQIVDFSLLLMLFIGPLSMLSVTIIPFYLLISNGQFRNSFTQPWKFRKEWLMVILISVFLLTLSLSIFQWRISDQTGELEGASVYWGFPYSWIRTGYFYAGFGGDYIRNNGGFKYIFRETKWYQNPKVLLPELWVDLFVYFVFGLNIVYWNKRDHKQAAILKESY